MKIESGEQHTYKTHATWGQYQLAAIGIVLLAIVIGAGIGLMNSRSQPSASTADDVLHYTPASGTFDTEIVFQGNTHLIKFRKITFKPIDTNFKWTATTSQSPADTLLRSVAGIIQTSTEQAYLANFSSAYQDARKLHENLVEWEIDGFDAYMSYLKDFYLGAQLIGVLECDGFHVVVIDIPIPSEPGREPIRAGMPVIKEGDQYLLAPGAKQNRPLLQELSKMKYSFMD
ncbi:MAG TPA: hypothetical protein DCM28_09820 [Phycisphaerales bacterium]|nr:hypothetical protein [Phycisphaerales bacterium]HCD32605.1 hypothetical protein [Phycisphaerales bacterium]|tara:strand:- start:16 stop:705 length:690 start_codon:yes stop_codon:yes gene_type:complete